MEYDEQIKTLQNNSWPCVAFTRTHFDLFFFSFFSKTSANARERAQSARKKNKERQQTSLGKKTVYKVTQRELQQRRRRQQREPQKRKKFDQQNNNFARVSHTLFCKFLCCQCTATTSKFLISRFMENVSKRRRILLSLSNLSPIPKKSTPGKFAYI